NNFETEQLKEETKPTETSKGKIKGNINSKGEKIYHKPGQMYYDRTNAEEYFSTEAEAEAAGYRPSKR
ncbi:MAG: thermonuclease family protein, partial [Bacilli bacterium]